MKNTNVKIVEEIRLKKITLIIYAAFFLGYMSRNKGRSPDNEDNFNEIHNLIRQITLN